jgi:hypothetical protein
MDDLAGGLAVIAFVIFVIYILVVYVLPLLIGVGVALAAIIAGWGFFSGMVVGVKNFKEVLKEAHEKLP